jgi:hypothetical protein
MCTLHRDLTLPSPRRASRHCCRFKYFDCARWLLTGRQHIAEAIDMCTVSSWPQRSALLAVPRTTKDHLLALNKLNQKQTSSPSCILLKCAPAALSNMTDNIHYYYEQGARCGIFSKKNSVAMHIPNETSIPSDQQLITRPTPTRHAPKGNRHLSHP